MKAHVTLAAAVAVLAGLAIAPPAEAGTINRRQANQQHRIAQGVASGALTPLETARLEARAVSIARQEAFMRATGCGLTLRERSVLHHRLDTLSGSIWREKHDRQRRR